MLAGNEQYLEHDENGASIWNQTVVDETLNKTEIIEATKLCAKANASIAISYSPWGNWCAIHNSCVQFRPPCCCGTVRPRALGYGKDR